MYQYAFFCSPVRQQTDITQRIYCRTHLGAEQYLLTFLLMYARDSLLGHAAGSISLCNRKSRVKGEEDAEEK